MRCSLICGRHHMLSLVEWAGVPTASISQGALCSGVRCPKPSRAGTRSIDKRMHTSSVRVLFANSGSTTHLTPYP